MDSNVQTLHLNDKATFNQWQEFLQSLGIENFATNELATIDSTLGIFNDNGELVATGSVAHNVLKYIAVCNKGIEQGSRFNTIVSALMSDRAQNGIFHLFVFTKPKYLESFQHIGFQVLAETDQGGILETGDAGIEDYLSELPKQADQEAKQIAGIVMNANPFTKGHRYLVEQAAKENDWVYVFVVSNDVSLFSTAARTELVTQGLADFPNVSVVAGGDYMVSYVTFPAYFLASADEAIDYQTTLDARLFKNWIAPAVNITKRYLGSEPLSRTTDRYNETLQRELPPEVAVQIVQRKQVGETVITATQVRRAIADDDIETIREFVPATTYHYIEEHLTELQTRIQEGMNINGN